jgi:galactofuranose transport system ATP-binding protein
MADDDTPSPVLELKGIHKQFGGIPVLRDVQLRLYPDRTARASRR